MQPHLRRHPAVLPILVVVSLLAMGGVASGQTLTVGPPALTFSVSVGGANPPAQTIQVNSTPQGVSFQARKQAGGGLINPVWLNVAPANGVTPAALTVTVNAANFTSPGTARADIIISLPQVEGVPTERVMVTVEVGGSSSLPAIGVSPQSLLFEGSPADPANIPAQQLRISNLGGGVLSYQLAITYPAGMPAGWLQVAPLSGDTATGPRTHQVAANATGLTEGQFTASINISGNATSRSVPVTLAVGPTAKLEVDPDNLSFSGSEGGANPAPQSIAISSTDGSALGYQIASDQPWLTVDPPSGTTAAGSQVHAVRVNLAGLFQGSFEGNLTITSPTTAALTVRVTLTIGVASSIVAIPSSLDFVGSVAIPIKERRVLSVVSNPLTAVGWTARVTPARATWLRIAPAEGTVPGQIIVEVDNLGLGGSQEAQIEISRAVPASAALAASGSRGAEQGAASFIVPVRLTLINRPPVLAASPQVMQFFAIEGSGGSLEQVLRVENNGGPELNWTAEVQTEAGSGWLTVTPSAGTAPTVAVVAASPAGLPAGVHQGMVLVRAGSQRVEVPVSLLVSATGGVLAVDRTALYFEAEEAALLLAPQRVRVLNRGAGPRAWSARIREQTGSSQWLEFTPARGLSDPAAELAVSARPSGLSPGVFYALIEVDPDDSETSRFLTVVLNVRPSSEVPTPTLDPSGLVFVAPAGGTSPGSQTITLRSNEPAPQPFRAAASTLDGANWLAVSPASGSTSPGQGAALVAQVSSENLPAGFYQGLISATFGDGLVRSAAVSLVVSPAGDGQCIPSALTVAALSPFQNFAAQSGRAVHLEAALADNCGRPSNTGAVLATFGNGDPAVALRPVGNGRYAATWAPRNAGSDVSVLLTASAGPFQAEAAVVGAITSTAAPRLTQHGTVNGASFASGEPLAPGSIVSSFGFNLASGNNRPESTPLPTTLGDVSLLVAGREAPLYFTGFSQVNAQLPFELEPATATEVIARVGNRFTVPQEIFVAAARPGLFFNPSVSGPDRAIAQNQDFRLNTVRNPAARGSVVILYLTGSGAVEPPVASGAAAPDAEPLARATLAASATIGGRPAGIRFLGLAPGFVGLTQANLLVPADAPSGPDVPVVVTIDGRSTRSLSIAIQ